MGREYVIVNTPEPDGLMECYARRDSYPAGQRLISTCGFRDPWRQDGFTAEELVILQGAGYSLITEVQALTQGQAWSAAGLADCPNVGAA